MSYQTQERSQRPLEETSIKLVELRQGNTALYENGQEDQARIYKAIPVPTKYYQVGEGSIEYENNKGHESEA